MSTDSLLGAFVNELTSGIITSPASMQKAPAFIGERRISGKEGLNRTFKVISAELKMKLHHTDAAVARFQYRP